MNKNEINPQELYNNIVQKITGDLSFKMECLAKAVLIVGERKDGSAMKHCKEWF